MNAEKTPRSALIGAWAIILGVLALSLAVFGPAALAVPFDFTVAKLFVQDGEDQGKLQRVLERFTSDSTSALLLLTREPGDWFDPNQLKNLDNLHQQIIAIETRDEDKNRLSGEQCLGQQDGKTGAFDRVTSLVNAKVFRRRGESVQIEDLRNSEGFGPATQNRQELLEHPLLKGRLISADGGSTLLMARVRCGLRSDAIRTYYLKVLREVFSKWKKDQPELQIHATGIPFIQDDIIATLRSELVQRQPFVGLGMLLFLWLAFRRFRYAVLPFVSVTLASVWWLGLMTLSGQSINIINFSTITVILVIGVGDAIHLVARVEEGLDAKEPPWEALKNGWLAMLPAVSLTTLTTVVGFASLSVARVELVRSYGISAAVGIGLAWFFTLTIVPAMLLLLPPKKSERSTNESLWLNRSLLPWVSALVRTHPKRIAGASVVLLVLSTLGATQLRPFSRALEEIRPEHRTQKALNALEAKFTGAMPFDIVLEGPRDELLAPQNLARIAELQDRLDASPAGVKSISIVDIVGSMHGLWGVGENGSRSELPPRLDQTLALLAMLEMDNEQMMTAYIDDPQNEFAAPDEEDDELLIEDESSEVQQLAASSPALAGNRIIALRIACLKKDSGSTIFSEEIKWIESELAAWPGNIKGELTGASKLATQAVGAVIVDMMTSLLLAFGLITLVFIAVLRSWRQGLLAMIPNILPLLATMALMAFAGLTLRISTVIIFAMCMGVVVDDTIHFLVRFRQQLKTQDFEAALDATVRHAGRPVIFTTMMLAMGFALLIPSQFNGLRDFGRLSSLCIGLALFADLLTLPAVLMLTKRWHEKKI
jgi:predicted RND superfamily exporter protein